MVKPGITFFPAFFNSIVHIRDKKMPISQNSGSPDARTPKAIPAPAPSAGTTSGRESVNVPTIMAFSPLCVGIVVLVC